MAIRTRAQLLADAAAALPDNNTGEISPEDVRQRIVDLADSASIKGDAANFVPFSIAGNGTNGPYTLPTVPANKQSLFIFLGGVFLHPDEYTLVGDQVSALPVAVASSNKLQGFILSQVDVGVPSNETVGAAQLKASDAAAMRAKLATDNASNLSTGVFAGWGLGNLPTEADPNEVGGTRAFLVSGHANAPTPGGIWAIQQIQRATSRKAQIAFELGGGSAFLMYARHLSAAGWEAWRTIEPEIGSSSASGQSWEWVKHGNGRMEITGVITITANTWTNTAWGAYSLSNVISLPLNFHSAHMALATVSDGAVGARSAYVVNCALSTSALTLHLASPTTSPSTSSLNVLVHAFGRWKA